MTGTGSDLVVVSFRVDCRLVESAFCFNLVTHDAVSSLANLIGLRWLGTAMPTPKTKAKAEDHSRNWASTILNSLAEDLRTSGWQLQEARLQHAL